MSFDSIAPDQLSWITAHEAGEPARHVAELSERLGLEQAGPTSGATARRPRSAPSAPQPGGDLRGPSGVLTMSSASRPRRAAPAGVVRASAGAVTADRQPGEQELLVYIHGFPPENEHAEIEPVV